MPNQYTRPPLPERFWSKVNRDGDCWLWTSCRWPVGYGRFWMGRRFLPAHRIAWELTHGPVSDGLCVLHRCDNPPCVRPDHLFLGTKADNNRDRHNKGRDARGDQSGARLHPEKHARGDNHPMRKNPEQRRWGTDNHAAKLTPADVFTIRRRYAAGGITYKQLASEYGVSFGEIGHIISRKVWQHVL